MDPTAYRCSVNDFADGEPWVEISGETYEQDEAEKAREEFVDKLHDELSTLENELEELEGDDEPDEDEVKEKQAEFDAKQAEIDACEAYSF